MARFVVGITVEYRYAVIRAVGQISPPYCFINPKDCCLEEIVEPCCVDTLPNSTVDFVLEGPFGPGCTNCQMSGSFGLVDAGSLIWGGTGAFGCPGAILEGKVYCEAGTWHFAGGIAPALGDPFFVDIPLEVDPVTGTLVGIGINPECNLPVYIAITSPCDGAVTWNCDDSSCNAIAGPSGTYATESECLAVCGTSWNCVDGECEEIAGQGGTYPDETTCITACITTYNCSAGSCVPVSGSGGTYATIGACYAACLAPGGTLTCCPVHGAYPSILQVTFSGATGTCGCLNGVTVLLTWTGVIWQSAPFDPCGSGVTTQFSFTQFCSIGFGANVGGCTSALGGTTTNSCTPLNVSGTVTVSGCCAGNITATITEVP